MHRSIRQIVLVLAALSAGACDKDLDTVAGPLKPGQLTHDVIPVSTIAHPRVGSGDSHSCAIRSDGTLACWGYPHFGVLLAPAGAFTDLDVGSLTNCVRTIDGQDTCWGFDAQGQAEVAPLPAGLTYTQVAAGRLAGCGVRSDSSIACWSGTTPGLLNIPAGSYSRVAVGRAHICAITTVGAIVCWGDDAFGQISTAPTTPAGKKFVQLDVGSIHSCAVLDDGNAVCWGDNRSGETNVPTLPQGVGYAEISVETSDFNPDQFGSHSCATRTDGSLVCWGGNHFGELNVPDLPLGVKYVSVSAGGGFTCASRSDGAVVCWGFARDGQLDVPSTLNLNKHAQTIVLTTPIPAEGSAGATFTLASTGGSGEPLVVNSTTPAVCSATGNVVSFDAAGICTFTIDRAGNDEYESAPRVTGTVNVVEGRASQTITFTSLAPTPGYVNDAYAASATGGASQNSVIFSSLTATTCTVSAATVTFVAAGECTVAANQAGNANYLKAEQVTQSITVSKRSQTIAFGPSMPVEGIINTQIAIVASGGASGIPVVFSSLTPAACSVTGTSATLTSLGDCIVAANQAGNGAYDAASQATSTIAVRWPFTGFDGLAAAPNVNRVTAGASLAATFSLGGNRGAAVIVPNSPTVVIYTCGASIPPAGSGTPTQSPGKSAPLVYDSSTGRYTYTWKTDKGWGGRCAQLSVRLADGAVHTALFQFK